jgi:hypothetical protein
MEKSRGADDQVDQMSQALNRLRAMVTAPEQQCQYCPIALAFQRVLGRGPQEPSALIHAQPVAQTDARGPLGRKRTGCSDQSQDFRFASRPPPIIHPTTSVGPYQSPKP